jgi:hypothetical protein
MMIMHSTLEFVTPSVSTPQNPLSKTHVEVSKHITSVPHI